jgi:hypothetical protein
VIGINAVIGVDLPLVKQVKDKNRYIGGNQSFGASNHSAIVPY